ncbi:MAG: hypothetical protein EG826_16020 [Deltaproteobacteria bacterium]|nr:hypothetical protein [Deltaproteobacteria bacterium]
MPESLRARLLESNPTDAELVNPESEIMKQHRRLPFSAVSMEVISLLAILVVAIIASLALIGWVLDIAFLRGLGPQWTAMRPITIMCFFMSAAAMVIIQQRIESRWIVISSRLLAIWITVVSFLSLVSYLVKLQTGQEWSWTHSLLLSPFLAPGNRMAIITAILFSIYGGVLLLFERRSRRTGDIAHAILLPMAMMTYLVLVGYLFNIRVFYEWLHLGVAFNTGIAFCALCIGSFFARRDTWLMNVFVGDKAGAIMARRLLPALLILPLLIGWLRMQGERFGTFSSEVGVALVAVVYTFCFLVLVWLNAKSVNRIDGLRRSAELGLRESEQQRTSELAAANKELESFSYSVSHDLRAPLRAIDGYSRMLLNKHAEELGEEPVRMLNVIRKNTEKMGHLIDDLLSFSRAQKSSISRNAIDMDKLINEISDEMQTENGERELDIKIGDILPGHGDSFLIRQVLFNLLSNAVKFTKDREPGIIEISSYEDGDRIVYCVKDNGAGFDMKYYDKLFGVFQRLHSRDEYEGTGIGLAIVQRIVKRHGGDVWADGGIDKGATFYFSLPSASRN